MDPKQSKAGTEPARLLANVEEYTKKGLPPVDQWNPSVSTELDIRIARNGQWFYNGSLMERDAMVRLFSTILRKDSDNVHYLVTPVEKVRIQVEDAPFVVVSMRQEGEGREQKLFMTTNVGDEVPLDAEHPLRVAQDTQSGEPSPYLLVRGRLEALISRSVYYELAAMVDQQEQEGVQRLGVWSAGCFFDLGGA